MVSSDVAMSAVGWGDMTLCRAVRDEVMTCTVTLGGEALNSSAMLVVVAGGWDGVGCCWCCTCLAGVDC